MLHLLANESITVNGDDAAGYWTYLQPSVLSGRAYWVAGRYHIDFRRQHGRWRRLSLDDYCAQTYQLCAFAPGVRHGCVSLP